jgi:hypothetical protein
MRVDVHHPGFRIERAAGQFAPFGMYIVPILPPSPFAIGGV